jgi:hypothetical protein
MKLSRHAQERSAERCIPESELKILARLGTEVQQKGGTVLLTIRKEQKNNIVAACKVALQLLKTRDDFDNRLVKHAKKTLKSLIKHASAKHQPFMVLNPESNKVITCGHYCAGRLVRN